MRLTRDKIGYIKQAVIVANMLNIEQVALEYDGQDGVIRAMNDISSVCLFHKNDFELPFTSLAIPQTKLLAARFNLVEGGENFSIEASIDEQEFNVIKLVLKNKSTKSEYTATNLHKIRAPKAIHDEPLYEFTIENHDLQTISQAATATPQSGEQKDHLITILGNADSVVFEVSDNRRDSCSHTVNGTVKTLTDSDEPVGFVWRYHLSTFLNVAKRSDDLTFELGKNGFLKTPVQQISTLLIPRV